MTKRMSAIFFGHGNPMNAISKNAYTEGWEAVGRAVPRPKLSFLFPPIGIYPPQRSPPTWNPRRFTILAAFHRNSMRSNIRRRVLLHLPGR